jgi:hypothetical protein
MGRACSSNGEIGIYIYIGYWWESQKVGDHWEDQDIGGWTILKWILERENGKVWFGLIWLRIQTLVNTVMNLRFL